MSEEEKFEKQIEEEKFEKQIEEEFKEFASKNSQKTSDVIVDGFARELYDFSPATRQAELQNFKDAAVVAPVIEHIGAADLAEVFNNGEDERVFAESVLKSMASASFEAKTMFLYVILLEKYRHDHPAGELGRNKPLPQQPTINHARQLLEAASRRSAQLPADKAAGLSSGSEDRWWGFQSVARLRCEEAAKRFGWPVSRPWKLSTGGKKSRRKRTKKSRTTSGKKSRKLRKRTTIKGGKRKRRRTRRRR